MLPLFLLVLAGTEALYRPLIFGRPTGGFLQGANEDGYTWTNSSYMIYNTITQKNDNFGSVNGTWQQRYQYNSKFFNSSRPLAFLMIGGEGEIGNGGDKWVRNENVTMMTYASLFGAAAFQVEHRFYGPKNCTPMGNSTVDSLQLLSIKQALADIDNFIGEMNKLYFSSYSNIQWITFGGSYPGTLSALFRASYPSRTIGAVSTSSAVHFFTDYYGYAVNTEYTYRTISPDCADNIGKGFQKMINLAYGGAASRDTLEKTFNLCNTFDNSTTSITKAVQYFFSNYYGLFQTINQYTGDNRDFATRSGLGVPGACAIMTNATYGDEMKRIKAVYDWQQSFYNGDPNKCADNSYDGFIQYMQDTSYSDLEQVAARSWVWQTCTSLGYFQTTDGNNGIFGSTVPLDFYADQCSSIFGAKYDLLNVFNEVNSYRSEYYDTYKGTKVVFPNGSFDPWKSLGFPESKKNDANDVDAFTINGTAHCANMYPASPNDTQSLKDARIRIQKHLDNWIKIGFSAPTPQNSAFLSSLPPITSFFLIYFL